MPLDIRLPETSSFHSVPDVPLDPQMPTAINSRTYNFTRENKYKRYVVHTSHARNYFAAIRRRKKREMRRKSLQLSMMMMLRRRRRVTCRSDTITSRERLYDIVQTANAHEGAMRSEPTRSFCENDHAVCLRLVLNL